MRTVRWLALILVSTSLLAPVIADARAGGGRSFGSRGTRTFQAPRPTAVAPAPKPVERSATPQPTAPQPAATAAPAAPAATGGFMSRNPFLSGVLGGVLGAGLMGMMFGGGFSGGALGGMGSSLLQLLLVGGLIFLVVSMFRRRSFNAPVAHRDAGFPLDHATARPDFAQFGGSPAVSPTTPVLPGRSENDLRITDADNQAFEALLSDVQAAYSKGDLALLRALVSPELVSYFSEALSGNVSRGVQNTVEAVKLEQGALSEAWSEAGLDYASVALRFSLLDVTRDVATGVIVEGSDTVRAEATEVWTYLRSPGGRWIVSAIQQA